MFGSSYTKLALVFKFPRQNAFLGVGVVVVRPLPVCPTCLFLRHSVAVGHSRTFRENTDGNGPLVASSVKGVIVCERRFWDVFDSKE